LHAQEIAKDFLSFQWVQFKISQLNQKKSEEKNKSKSISNTFNQEGFKLYKSKKDSEALKKYESAIDNFPTGEVYYNYANSLSNIGKLENSIKAYEISLKLDPPRPELSLYNIACSYSRLNQIEKAYSYIARAVDRGYNAFEFIKKDPDMANLRKVKGWEDKIKSIKKSANIQQEALVGVLEEQTPRSPNYYFLCKSGIVLIDRSSNFFHEYGGNLCEGEDVGYSKGNWKLVNGDLQFEFTESCVPDYIPTKAKENKEDGSFCRAFKPKPASCKKITDVNWNSVIQREEVRSFVQKDKKQDDYPGYSLTRFNSGKEPKQCDPNFKIQNISDYKIQK
jgi:tetratricopeptide (TPR) repeat protein